MDQVGVNMTLDKDLCVGLSPDSWHLVANHAQPALNGPMLVEPALRTKMDLPTYSRLRKARATDKSLSWQKCLTSNQVCETMVLSVARPDMFKTRIPTIPHVNNFLDASEGWQYLPDLEAVAIRILHREETERVAILW